MGLNTRKRDRVVAIGAAKNCITIGASESTRQTASTYHDAWPLNYPQPPIRNDSISGNLDGMAAFSSPGPTKEGQFKPDVVAPGTSILSTRSRISHLEP
ncbi:hypothetical protein AWENTII_008220 [Aspergillus wentii]